MCLIIFIKVKPPFGQTVTGSRRLALTACSGLPVHPSQSAARGGSTQPASPHCDKVHLVPFPKKWDGNTIA